MVHVEVEARFRKARVPRLADYNRLLTLRYGVGVHTVVIHVRGGPAGLREQEYTEESFGRQPWTFRYTSLGLSGASGREYLERPEPLAWGLAALMRPDVFRNRAELGIACLSREEGRKKGREEGRKEAMQELVLRLLASPSGSRLGFHDPEDPGGYFTEGG